MSSDVIIGYDGKPRCAWAGAGDSAFGRYHDEVWGSRTHDESAMFEALTLGVFEVGLTWSIVFSKRDAFRAAFRDFDVAKVAAMTDRDVDRLVGDASIIRNRGKIQATVDNARAMTSASPNLAALAASHEVTRKRAPRSIADLPKSTPQAEVFSSS
jgi:DNA-3-methyladenine glycosylase I